MSDNANRNSGPTVTTRGSLQPTSTNGVATTSPAPLKPRRLLCKKELADLTSLSIATINRHLKELRTSGAPVFPVPVHVTGNMIGWHAHEVDDWIASRARWISGAPVAGPPSDGKPWRLIPWDVVSARTGLARATIYRRISPKHRKVDETFPLPVHVSQARIAWIEHEVEAWIASRPRKA